MKLMSTFLCDYKRVWQKGPPHCLLRLYKMGRGVSFFLHTPNWDKILISILKLNYNKEWGEENSLT